MRDLSTFQTINVVLNAASIFILLSLIGLGVAIKQDILDKRRELEQQIDHLIDLTKKAELEKKKE
jgi:hypothetical protein